MSWEGEEGGRGLEEKGLNEGKQCAASVLVASLTFAPEASVCRRGKKKRKKKEKKREREREKGEKMEVEEERAEVRVLYGSAEVADHGVAQEKTPAVPSHLHTASRWVVSREDRGAV